MKTKQLIVITLVLLGGSLCSERSQAPSDAKGQLASRSKRIAGETVGIPPDPRWFDYQICEGYSDDYVTLTDMEFDEIPTSGRRQNLSLTLYTKKTAYADVAYFSVTWQGIPFYSSQVEFQIFYEAGQSYTEKKLLYLDAAPAGMYLVKMMLINEFGNVFSCYNIQVYVRPNKTLANSMPV